jgi:hypothetical protein
MDELQRRADEIAAVEKAAEHNEALVADEYERRRAREELRATVPSELHEVVDRVFDSFD